MREVQTYIHALRPYRDIIIFMITLFAANYFWKFTVIGDEDGEMVTWFGVDITALFEAVTVHITNAVYALVSLFRDTAYRVGEHTIRFESGSGTSIIWGCSGIKQSFIWLCLVLAIPRGWKHKIWFIPLGWLCCYLFNILRIALIALFIEHHPDWFPILHDYIFKYLFYAMLFGLWVWFVERIAPDTYSHETTSTT